MSAGEGAEDLAARYLTARGLKLVERNYRCRQGEIDLVMRDGEALVFVEVRLRTHPGFGGAAESIDARKQQRCLTAARHYLQRHPADRPCRFDVLLLASLDPSRIQWLRDAFGE